MRCAVLDIGSNSIKFLVAERKGRSTRVVSESSESTRLAEDLIQTGQLKETAIRRTLRALRRLRSEAKELGVKAIYAVATSAVRDSKNRKLFLKEAGAILGTRILLLPGDEEAETIFVGVASDPHWRERDLFVIDVGGGSGEWIQGKALRIERRESLPLGCVRLRERFIRKYPVNEVALRRLFDGLHQQLQPALAQYNLGDRLLVGTGGTINCLAAMELGLHRYDAKKIDHFCLSRRKIGNWIDKLKKLSLAQLRHMPGLPPKRADIILPGAAVFYVSMEILGAHGIYVSTRGLRYGVLNWAMQPNHPALKKTRSIPAMPLIR
jgi:exopolyphosphatase/guanosine-5'-triphosphate,3'-diphosphate pyrophosphatase